MAKLYAGGGKYLILKAWYQEDGFQAFTGQSQKKMALYKQVCIDLVNKVKQPQSQPTYKFLRML